MPQTTEMNKGEMQADCQNTLWISSSHISLLSPHPCESSAGPLHLKIDPEDLCGPHTAQRVLQQLLGSGFRDRELGSTENHV